MIDHHYSFDFICSFPDFQHFGQFTNSAMLQSTATLQPVFLMIFPSKSQPKRSQNDTIEIGLERNWWSERESSDYLH